MGGARQGDAGQHKDAAIAHIAEAKGRRIGPDITEQLLDIKAGERQMPIR